jgi:hypothetical protein
MDEFAAAMQAEGDAGAPAAAPPASPSAGAHASQGVECVVCYAAAADVLLPVCGHVALCGACCAALELRARREGNAAAACPVCRAPLRRIMLSAPAQIGCYVPPQPRLHALLRLCAGEQGVESLFSQHAASDAVGPDNAENLGSRDVVHRALHALDAFAEHSGEQKALALRDGAVDAACHAMCVAPLGYLAFS